MPVPFLVPLLLLGGVGGVAAFGVHQHAKNAAAATTAPPPRFSTTFTLDANIPPALQGQILAALVRDVDPAHLDAFATSLRATFPIAAAQLAARASIVRAVAAAQPIDMAPQAPAQLARGATASPASPASPTDASIPPAPAPAHPPPPPASTFDAGMPANLSLAVAKALADESDAARLRGFSAAIVDTFPIAAGVLAAKAQALSAPSPASPPASPSSPAAPPRPVGLAYDAGLPANLASAVTIALTQETDPARLEALASVLTAYPIAAGLLRARARNQGKPSAAPEATPNAAKPRSALSAIQAAAAPPVTAPASPLPTRNATYVVKAGDTAATIARTLVHAPGRWPELVAANPTKAKAASGNFQSLVSGEVLHLPNSWAARSS